MTLGSKLPAFFAGRQLMTRRQKAGAVTSRLNTTAVCGRSGARLMRVIPQREPGGELYVRPCTSALLSDSLHNIVQLAKIWGGTNNIGAPPLQILGGDASPPSPRCLRLCLTVYSSARLQHASLSACTLHCNWSPIHAHLHTRQLTRLTTSQGLATERRNIKSQ